MLHASPDKLKPEEKQELLVWLANDPRLERLYQSLQDIRAVYAFQTPGGKRSPPKMDKQPSLFTDCCDSFDSQNDCRVT
ncbi:MAG: hypothetical protein ACQEXX_24220 [Bacillota bacterium]